MNNRMMKNKDGLMGGRRIGLLLLMACLVMSAAGCGRKAEVITIQQAESAGQDSGAMQSSTETESSCVLQETAAEEPGTAEKEQKTIFVYVCGQVKKPGVYELPVGSRLCDAVEMAGGMTEEAAADFCNLARSLQDGEMIYLPTKEEAREQKLSLDPLIGDGSVEAGGAVSDDGIVNINTADRALLTTLSGIGENRADAIVAYRTKHGAFSSKEDIVLVSGIGPALYDSIKDMITVE